MGVVGRRSKILKKAVTLELLYSCDTECCEANTNNLVEDRWIVVHRLLPEKQTFSLHFCCIGCLLLYFKKEAA